MPAFAAAVALGYTHLETDAHLSRDGVVFAFHDTILDRLTDGHGRLADLPAATIARIDAAHHFSRDGSTHPLRGTGIRIPTMEELLTTWPDVFVNIDTKSDAVVTPLLDLIRRLGAMERVCIGSFSDARIALARRLSGGAVCTSMGPRALTLAWLASRSGRVPRLGADCVQVPPRARRLAVVDRRFLRACRGAGLQVHVWTIDEPAEMTRLLDLGVDAIMTDRPAVLRDVLRARGSWNGRDRLDA